MATERPPRHERQQKGYGPAWDDGEDEDDSGAFKPLTAAEASALRARNPPLSPWRVLGAQAVVGLVMALLAVLFTGEQVLAWSMLYGAATVVLPGALLARGMATNRLSGLSAASSAVSFMLWEAAKIGLSVLMLLLAPMVVQPLSWPALLAALVVCMQVYWLALLWRGRQRTGSDGIKTDGS